MQIPTSYLRLFLILGIFLATSSALTHVEWECEDDCHLDGFCAPGPTCHCHRGFYGDDCSEEIFDSVPGAVITFQVILAIGYAITLGLSGTAAYFASTENHDANLGPVTRIRMFLFLTLTVMSFINFVVTVVDPLQQLEIIPDELHHILSDSDLPLATTAFILVLFHWIELVQISTSNLKRERMLQQINANYPGKTITVEDMVESLNVLRKFRIPFLILGITSFIVIIVCDIFFVQHYYPFTMYMIIYTYFGLLWIALTLGFLLYGKRLVELLPFQLSGKMKKVTRRLTILSVINLVIFVSLSILLAVGHKTAAGALVIWVINDAVILTTNLATLLVFLRINKKFPFVSFSSSSSTKSSKGETPQASQSPYVSEVTPETPRELKEPPKEGPSKQADVSSAA